MRLSSVYEKHLVQYQARGKCYLSISGHHYSYYQLPEIFLGSGGIHTEYKDRYSFPMDICQLPNILFLSACDILAIDKSLAPITLVLAEDGTIVDDDDYFLPTQNLWHQLGMRSGHTTQVEVQLGLPESPSKEMRQIVGQA